MDAPWKDEPNRKEWESNGFKCLIVRHDTAGFLCGYVGIPEGHPWHGVDYNDIEAEVHGGLTFGDEGDGERWPKGSYWVGFDCAHGGDLIPWTEPIMLFARGFSHKEHYPDEDTYRDIVYVTNETESLARQAAEAVKEVAV